MTLQGQEEYFSCQKGVSIWNSDDENTRRLQNTEKEKIKKKVRRTINERTSVCNLTDITEISNNSLTLSNTGEYQGIVKVAIPMEGMREWVEYYISQRETCKVKNREYAFCKNVRRGREPCRIVK